MRHCFETARVCNARCGGDRDALCIDSRGKRLFRSGNGSPSPRFQQGKSFYERTGWVVFRFFTAQSSCFSSIRSTFINYTHLFIKELTFAFRYVERRKESMRASR